MRLVYKAYSWNDGSIIHHLSDDIGMLIYAKYFVSTSNQIKRLLSLDKLNLAAALP